MSKNKLLLALALSTAIALVGSIVICYLAKFFFYCLMDGIWVGYKLLGALGGLVIVLLLWYTDDFTKWAIRRYIGDFEKEDEDKSEN